MPSPYKAEIFDRTFTFKDFSPIQNPSISFDYLTLEPTKIVCPRITADKGDFVVISREDVVYQGIVDDIQIDTAVTLSIKPLLSLFDCDVHFDRTQSHQLETFIAGIIAENWENNTDTAQNVTGLTVTTTSSTTGYLNLKDNVHNLYEIITKALTGYGIVVDFVTSPQDKTAEVVIGKQTATAVIETDLHNVIGKVLTIGDSYGATNKITVYDADNAAQTPIVYYLHTDGTVSTSPIGRITPVFPTVDEVTVDEGDTFADAAHEAAYDALKPRQFDNCIEVTILDDNRLVSSDMAIGTVVTVYDKSSVYKSILTGYTRSGRATTLLLGNVRIDLTKKLILERRRST